MALSRLPDILETIGSKCDVRVVLIPGLGPTGPPVREWGICNGIWQAKLNSLNCTSSVSMIDHGVVVDNRFNYDRLLGAGEQLQKRLVEWYEREEKHGPIILIAHSLGGTILKQALCWLKVKADSYDNFARLLNLIAGTVFISCPHGLYDEMRLKKHVAFLINRSALGSLSSQVLRTIEEGFGDLYTIHKRYSEVRFRFDTCSLFETEPCVQKKALGRSKSLTIVDREMATIDREVVVGLDGDHFGICALSDADGQPDLIVAEKLCFMIESAVSRVRERTLSYDMRLSQSKTPSLRTQASVEAMRRAFSEISVEAATTSQATLRGSPVFNRDMDTIFEKFSPNQLQVKLPCFMMDSSFNKNNNFFGREGIISQIDQLLLPVENSVAPSAVPSKLSVVVINGMAGLGKTEIAMEYVFTRQDHFDGVFWICAENETKLETDFCRIATELGIQENGDQVVPTITKNKIRDWLSNPRKILNGPDEMACLDEANWLLIFDNADDPVILNDYLQIYGRGSILITSRDPLVVRNCHADATIIDLPTFEENEALAFLNKLTRKSSSNDEDRRITALLAGLPLAISQIASVISDQFLEYADLLESLQNPEDRLDVYKDGRINKTARGDMTSIWMIEKLEPNARFLLEVISCFFPDQIADDLLLARKDGNLVIGMRRPIFNKARANLLRSSLIRHNEDKKEIWIHRVPRQIVRANLNGNRRQEVFLCALNLLKATWPVVKFEQRHNKATVALRDALLPHVLSLKEFYENEWPVKESLTDHVLATLLQETAWFMYERGNLVRAKPIAQLSLEIASSATLADDDGRLELLASIHDTLGCIANGTNRPIDSMSHNRESLALRKQLSLKLGVEGYELAYANNQMGCAWMMNKDYEKGREAFTEALRIWHLNPAYKKGLASMEYANLGLCNWLLSDFETASNVLEEGLKEREEGFGLDSMESFRPGRIFHALGNVRGSQERYAESEELHQKAMKVYLTAVGPQYHRVADMCHKLAQHCIRRGDEESLRKALKLVDQALAIWGSDRKAYEPEIARTTFLKSKILYHESVIQGNGDSPSVNAHELFDDALDMFRELTGQSLRESTPTEEDFDGIIMFWSR